MAMGSAPSEILEKQQKILLKILQQDLDSILDKLTSQRLISEDEYETLEKVVDPLKKNQKLLTLVQKKGEVSCQSFLQDLLSAFPESATTWGLSHEFLKHGSIASSESMALKRNSEDTSSPGTKNPENPEIIVSSKEKEHLALKSFELYEDKKTSHRELALSSMDYEKACDTPKVTLLYSVEKAECEIPATITHLKDGQRYEEPDDSLYLSEGEYQESVGYSENAETTVQEEDYNDPDHIICRGEEDTKFSNATGFSDEEQSFEHSEANISLEEEEKSMEDRKKVFKDILSCLNLDRSRKLLPDSVKQFALDRGCGWTPETPGDLAWNFLMKVQALDVTARDSILRHQFLDENSKEELLIGEKLEIQNIQTINPLDVLCACMLCSDSSLQREVMSNMHQCQFALPLLLPDAENNKSILMLGAMKDIVKEQLPQSSRRPTGDEKQFLSLMKLPVISFVRLGHCSFSKSRILNILLSPAQVKSHKIFLHQDFSGLVLPRQISDGLVEITWCFPDDLEEGPNFFQKPVAVANLRGDLENLWTQFGFLMEVSSAVFFLTDCLDEKEWDLLMFLGEAAIERCYFVLSPQARKSEEAQIFQRILNLKPSQLLFWEWEEAGGRRTNMEGLRSALQEVMSSPLRSLSVEDMASLARELGIQVDRDFEDAQGMRVSPGENAAGTANGVGQQRHSQPKSLSESQPQMHTRESGERCEVSQNFQNFHHIPALMPHLEKSWLLPTEGNVSHASLKAPWIMSSHFGSEQRSKWFGPFPFQNVRDHSRPKHFGIQYFQPQRFYSDKRFMESSRMFWGNHLNGTFRRMPRPILQHGGACPERPQTIGAPGLSGSLVSQVGHPHSLGSRLAGAAGQPWPVQPCDRGTQLAMTTGQFMRPTPRVRNPNPQSFQPAGDMQTLVSPALQQGTQLMRQHRSSNPAFQTRSSSMSMSKLTPSSLVKSHQPKPPQAKHFQPQPSQPVPSQPSQKTNPQPQLPRASPSSSKPSQPQPSQSKPAPPRPKSSQASPSQPKASSQKARSKRAGKR